MAAQPEDRVALVTGAGPLGRGVAKALAEAGARVAVVALEADAGELERLGVLALQADVSDSTQIEAVLDRVAAELGEVDVLVAGAGRRVLGSFLEMREADLRRSLDVDVWGSLACVQQVGRRLLARSVPGRLILLGSVAGLRTVPGTCPHAIAMAMNATIAQVAAMELAPAGITCNFVATGWTQSSFLEEEVDREVALAATPSGRLIDPAEVGAVCAFLASAAGGGVNGAVIPVDGGYSIGKSPGGSPIRVPS